jgi:hypothetical protein
MKRARIEYGALWAVGLLWVSHSLATQTTINWQTLMQVSLSGKEVPTHVKNLNGQSVKMAGYMIPLEGNENVVTEFLLVPSLPACIHVPPPPPNQTVHVKMAAKKGIPYSYMPIWVTGTFRIESSKSLYGDAFFALDGEKFENF